ncbi:hypothetical protein CHU95_03245 [Niveispirillum lacus]|uniref:Uncharacterized protein n=1 Tax=Niveispirillum lacus TaxID=1981099 RepID=A0A255Z844_9PROT|nr:hypothetical protein CHU95_03245 [Niveispirillum lacus]
MFIAAIAAWVVGAVCLAVSAFWMGSVLFPAGIGGVVGGWLLYQRSMERIARDNGVDLGDR